VEELFAVRAFLLCIQYEDKRGVKFETTCELNFRPWKKQVTVGRITTTAPSVGA
jgi:hypothetical protein